MAEDAAAKKPAWLRRVQAVVTWALGLRAGRTWQLYSDKQGSALADSITYRALFSVFAAVLLGFSVASLWLAGNPEALGRLTSAVNAVVPGLVGRNGLVDPNAIHAPVGISITGIASLVGLIGAAIGAIGSLRIALRTLAGTIDDDVAWYWVSLRNLGLAVAIGVAFLLSAVASFAGGLGVDLIASFFGFARSPGTLWTERIVSLVIVFALDTVLIAGVFTVLSGVCARGRTLWGGAALGGVGLLALQQLSSLFVGGATSNPLLASFAALIALLLWLNLSAQVVLLASAWIITGRGDDAVPQRPSR